MSNVELSATTANDHQLPFIIHYSTLDIRYWGREGPSSSRVRRHENESDSRAASGRIRAV
jgi:hypothetical protein